MRFLILCACLLAHAAWADSLRTSYSTTDGRAGTVIIACPSRDGSFAATPCTFSQPGPATYAGPDAGAIATANVAVTVFAAGEVVSGCDIVNTGQAVLYLDFTASASAGSATSIPLQPGQAYHCPVAPTGAVTAVAAQPQSFVATRY